MSFLVLVHICDPPDLKFFERFFLVFLFVMMLPKPTYCCTHRLDTGNRLPHCQGEVDFICQVPIIVNKNTNPEIIELI